MRINKEEYNNIKIPDILDEVVQDAIDEGLEKKRYGKTHILRCSGMAVAAAFSLFVVVLNTSPVFARAAANVPVIGDMCQVFTFRDYEYEDEIKYVNVKVPQINNTGNTELEDRINREIAKSINNEVAKSEQMAEDDYNAYILTGGEPSEFMPYNIVIDYEIKCQDEHYVSFVITKDETRATGYYQTYYYNIDLDTGKEITLRDWYGSNYKQIVTESINKQIDDWDDDKKFYLWDDLDMDSLINDDTQFYINENEQIVVFFNKYELGAGAMGTQEFTIDVD